MGAAFGTIPFGTHIPVIVQEVGGKTHELMNDSRIIKKMEGLELTRLDKQIMEEMQKANEVDVIKRHAKALLDIVNSLWGQMQ